MGIPDFSIVRVPDFPPPLHDRGGTLGRIDMPFGSYTVLSPNWKIPFYWDDCLNLDFESKTHLVFNFFTYFGKFPKLLGLCHNPSCLRIQQSDVPDFLLPFSSTAALIATGSKIKPNNI